jgi:hypothetical protein
VFGNSKELFYFYHAGLGSSNIMMTEDEEVVEIIDCESVAYYPMFWLGTEPLVSAGYCLQGADRRAWVFLLASALEPEGLSPAIDKFQV